MTAGDLANGCIVGGHRPPLQRESPTSCTFCAKPLLCEEGNASAGVQQTVVVLLRPCRCNNAGRNETAVWNRASYQVLIDAGFGGFRILRDVRREEIRGRVADGEPGPAVEKRFEGDAEIRQRETI